MFNLTVSIVVLVYQKQKGRWEHFQCSLEFLVGIVRINGPMAIYCNNERIKAHVFNAKEKREISYGYLRSFPSNLLGSLSVHLLWSWIKEIGMPHARALTRLARPGRGRGRGRGRGHDETRWAVRSVERTDRRTDVGQTRWAVWCGRSDGRTDVTHCGAGAPFC
jgi:hypothetical protein